MKSKGLILMLILTISLLLIITGFATAQSNERGQIRGVVYEDVNGDGICVNSGVAGENPVVGVPIEFVSSDEATVVNLTTGSDGSYGLVAAGQSIWRVTAKPDPLKWTVTSENPLHPPVLPETGLIQTDVNFCISKGGTATGDAVIILPASGAAANATMNTRAFIVILATIGASFLTLGMALEFQRRQSAA